MKMQLTVDNGRWTVENQWPVASCQWPMEMRSHRMPTPTPAKPVALPWPRIFAAGYFGIIFLSQYFNPRFLPGYISKTIPKQTALNRQFSPISFQNLAIRFLLTIAFALAMTTAYAQTPYTGGSGDGYGRTEFIYIHGDPPGFVPSQIYPTVIGVGETFTVRMEGIRTKVEIIVRTSEGKFVHRNVAWEIGETYEQRIGTEGWAAGLYLVEVRIDGRAYLHKLIVMRRE
jgi:hypothetical protein